MSLRNEIKDKCENIKRRLIIVNTYYQLIMAVQMKTTLFARDEVVLLLSDHSKDAEKICERLKEQGVFYEAAYIETKRFKRYLPEQNQIDKLKDCLQISIGKTNRYEKYFLGEIKNLFFDELIFFNFDFSVYGVYSVLANHNKAIGVSMFEEGIFSYKHTEFDINKRMIFIKKLRRFFGGNSISDVCTKFYCLYPQIYNGELEAVQIPQITEGCRCIEILKEVFEVNPDALNYPEKYIFFTTGLDFEGGKPIGEYQLVCKVAEVVGKDNLLVKIHPRDTRNIYTENGFKVDVNSSVPWEIIQLSKDFSDKIFLTTISGSVISGSLITNKIIQAYFMVSCCEVSGNEIAERSVKSIHSLLNNGYFKDILSRVYSIDNVEEIKNEG